MNRRIRIILLAISLLLVIGTLGWLTHVLLVQAEETGHSEQRIRVEALAHEAKLEMDRLLTSFITFEQARGYFEYQPVYAYKRPYDLRMGAPAPGEATRGSNLAAYLPDYVTAFIQISPAGRVTGPALPPELAGRLNEQKDLYQRLNGKVSSLPPFRPAETSGRISGMKFCMNLRNRSQRYPALRHKWKLSLPSFPWKTEGTFTSCARCTPAAAFICRGP